MTNVTRASKQGISTMPNGLESATQGTIRQACGILDFLGHKSTLLTDRAKPISPIVSCSAHASASVSLCRGWQGTEVRQHSDAACQDPSRVDLDFVMDWTGWV
ncbi:hypothetical protein HGRIS_006774 [Hohenbuehelia grisea]|uniref:Uncharacterized protein n=1 Tax=Hohenbuehelia grisea TaxID=104357 RepID=A0ABR3JAA6_9AGAR